MISLREVPVDSLFDAPKNPNKMDPDKYARLVESIRRFGFWVPVLVRDSRRDADGNPTSAGEGVAVSEIADGHHRVRAAREVGLPTVPCINVSGLSDAEIEVLKLGLNRLRGEADLSIVADVLHGIVQEIPDVASLEVTGFSEAEITNLLASLTRGEGDDKVLAASDPEPADDSPHPFVLEIEFESKEMYQFCRKKLRRAAGKGNDLYVGVMRTLGEDPNDEKWR